ncbi:MAG: BON domain-containing protein, partial [Ascidiaceihabitans sp.]|nr:BON domain-containing protein [Ascidiaceihabitans sp.]
MGLWSFVKGSGKKLFGGGDEPALDGGALQDEIKELGLDATGMEITVDGDTVKVSGEAVSQEMKEKVILAVGNVSGVASVE